MGEGILYTTGVEAENSAVNFSKNSVPPLYKNQSPKFIQELSGDPNPQYFLKSTAVQMGGVLPYKWETYCRTNGRRTAWCPFIQSIKRRKVQRYKWGAYCRTNWRCIAVLSPRPVGVRVSETLLIHYGYSYKGGYLKGGHLKFRRIPRAHKNKIGTPPPQNPKCPPPLNFMRMEVFLRKESKNSRRP